MNRFYLTSAWVLLLFSVVGCASGSYSMVTLYQQEAGNGYCHKKLQPLGPADPARPTPLSTGDLIDYYGPCNGPSIEEQTIQQKRFEQFRFGREYMSEG